MANAKTGAADVQALLDFLAASPTPFHAVKNVAARLEAAGFARASLSDVAKQEKCFLTSNDSALIAVSINAPLEQGFRILGAHTDSPCLKVKPHGNYVENGYLQLGVEVYGGALLNPWFDRDLSLAGRVTGQTSKGEISSMLINFERAIATIPSLAIHLDRDANNKRSINAQQHLPPVMARVSGDGDGSDSGGVPEFERLLIDQLKAEHGHQFERILGFELSLYDTQLPALVGLRQEFIASARLDNLLSCYVSTEVAAAHAGQSQARTNCVVVLNDHEEVGSRSHSGAAGPFLESVLQRFCGNDEYIYREAIEHSLLVSVDNAHALHPNYAALHEPRHQPMINGGPVVKINHDQRYATNSETQAAFVSVCEAAGLPYQKFVVRSDLGCGSTIGPITATELGVRTLDIGVPQWAMHSIREQAGVEDIGFLRRALEGVAMLKQLPWS